MAQLYVPRFVSLPAVPMRLRVAESESSEVLIVVLGRGQARSTGQLTRLSSDFAKGNRVRRRQPHFSWRSAWLGALSALGLVGGLAAAADATQPDHPIRIALPPTRPAAALAPSALVESLAVPSELQGRLNTRLRAENVSVLRMDTSTTSSTRLDVITPKSSPQPNGSGSGEFYRAEPLQGAAQRAILSGIAQTWTYGGLTGVVIAGPLELRSSRACHRIALWAENRPDSGDSMAFTSCLNEQGQWRTPAGLRPELTGDYGDLPQLP